MNTRVRILLGAAFLLTTATIFGAETPLPDPTMTPSSEYDASYLAANAQDENYGTDWATAGQTTDAYADFNFGAPVRITRFEFTDRVTSGGTQGTQSGGNIDDVSSFDLIFSQDATFGNGDDIVVPLASGMISPGYATESYVINEGNGYLAQYVRWDVTGVSGGAPVNVGAAEFDFFTDTADLSISKSAPTDATVGQNIAYTITVTNNGPAAASDVQVTDTIPLGTTFVSATPSQGSCIEGPPVQCDLNEILNGAQATITLIVTATTPGEIANTATVTNSGPEVDPTPGDVSAPAATSVSPAVADVPVIPTASMWGLLAMMAALLVAAVVKLR